MMMIKQHFYSSLLKATKCFRRKRISINVINEGSNLAQSAEISIKITLKNKQINKNKVQHQIKA